MGASETLTIDEVAARLGVSRKTVYAAAHRHEIPVLRIGRRLVVPRVPFEKWLETGAPLESQGSGE